MQQISRSALDDQKWNECILRSFNGLVYSTTWYLDAASPGWQPCVSESGSEYQACMALPLGAKFGLQAVRQPLFMQQLGVHARNEAVMFRECNSMNEILGRYKYVVYHANYAHQPGEGFVWQPRKNYVLPLMENYDILSSAYNANRRRTLGKANELGLDIVSDFQPDLLIGLFQKTSAAKGARLSKANFKTLRHIMLKSVTAGFGRQVSVYQNDVLHAGAFFHVFKDRVTYLFGASNMAGRKSNAMTKLFDSIIRDYAGSSFILDFEGSNEPELARFYASFGASDQPYWQLRKNTLPFPLRNLVP